METTSASEIVYADLVPRFSAFVIDVFILAPIIIVMELLVGEKANSDAFIAITGNILFFTYFFATESLWGQSLGKKLLKIKVVSIDGSPANPLKIAIRNCIGLFERNLIGACFIAISKKKERLGDMVAGTIVVRI